MKTIIILLLLISFNSFAVENIYIKYRGYIEIDENSTLKDIPIKYSSFVNRVLYDSLNQYLVVQLRNTYYQYCRIPDEYVSEWINSYSLGRYYNHNIRRNFDCRLGGVPEY